MKKSLKNKRLIIAFLTLISLFFVGGMGSITIMAKDNIAKPTVTVSTDKLRYQLGDTVYLIVKAGPTGNHKVRVLLTPPGGKTITSPWSASEPTSYAWVTGKRGFVLTDKNILKASSWANIPTGTYTLQVEATDGTRTSKSSTTNFTVRDFPAFY